MLPISVLTGTALCTEALEELRAMTAGDSLNSTDGAKALACLNRMIDTTDIDQGNIATERIDQWTLTIGKQKYTIGTDPAGLLTPDLTPADRPVRLTRANWLMQSASNTVRRKITLLTKEQWGAKAVQSIPGPPIELYNDEAYPLSTYYFYMVPDQAYVIETRSWQQFQPLATLGSFISVPPGYYEFWMYSLVMRLAGPFGLEPKDTTIQLWKEAKSKIENINTRASRIRGNGDLPPDDGAGIYNWISGETEA